MRDDILVDAGPTVRAYHLRGTDYVPVLPDADGRLACASLPLTVGVHDGWVRWFDLDGNLLPTRGEFERQRANTATQQRDAEHQRADFESARADALELRVKALQAELDRRSG